ncbi:MAG TPA: S-layer homology domain-containing protein [Chloroflexia bacterium]|nr:S-layer homology domain-containing protein [Chloroflexia bacterium]
MYQKSRSLGHFIVSLLALLFGTGFLIGTVTLAGARSQSEAASASKLQGGDGCWRAVPVPTSGPPYGYLTGIVAISEDNAWAVGGHDKGIIEHWDGAQWTTTRSNLWWSLNGVAAVASDDIWAVGSFQTPGSFGFKSLTMHWDGTQWSDVPNPQPNGSELNSVVAISSDDVWAVGTYDGPGDRKTLTIHWDGTSWNVVPSPNPGQESRNLFSVAATAPDDVWAVGIYAEGQYTQVIPLFMHWDGTSWSLMPGLTWSSQTQFRAIAAIAPDNLWIAGFSDDTGGLLVMRWDGTKLNFVPVPRLYGLLDGITFTSPSDIWLSGGYRNASTERIEMLILHCDGATCRAIPAEHPQGSSTSGIKALSTSPEGSVWGVGYHRPVAQDYYHPLIARYNPDDSCPYALPPSVTPVTATPTRTATATPTGCALQFYDVPPSHTFYPYVRCLACKGIIGGYSDYSFRPNNLLTRDQIAKMVSNSAGFNEPPGTQIFEDIPPTHAFYDYIQRLANRGIMTGYPCGGAGEPCVEPHNRPYFRVGTFTTRGQIAKIVAQAKGYTDPVQGQRVEDVPPSNAFYLYIERLASRGIMGGYPCGTLPNEPCGITNRPYFRWGNNATRGQTTKITSNTFFPGCAVYAGR